MKAFWALLKALLLNTVRNRQGLFWTFFSPLMFMIVFSLFGNQNFSPLKVYLVPGSKASVLIRAVIRHNPAFKLESERSFQQGLTQLKKGKIDAVVVAPLTFDPAHLNTMTAYYNNSNYLAAQQLKGLMAALNGEINIALSGRPPAFSVRFHAVAGQHLTYLDFLVPGIMAMMAMNNSLFGLAGGLTRWKENGVLRRFLASPVRPLSFLGALIINQLLVGLLSLAIVVGIAILALHAHEFLPPLSLLVILTLGVSAFLAIGFLIGGIAKSQEAVMPLINLVAFPMMFLSGVFYPVSNLPATLHHIVNYFPLTFLVDAVRNMMNGGVSWNASISRDAIGLGVWLVLASFATVRTWKWEA